MDITSTTRTDAAGVLPPWTSVLAVVAHPDDESFGLGAILDAFSQAGASVEVLCLTHGEASTLHGTPGELASVREAELAAAALALGVNRTSLLSHPDGALDSVPHARLVADVTAVTRSSRADGLLVFDTGGVTGHADHVTATSVGLSVAVALGLPVLGWTVPGAVAAQLNKEFGARFRGHQEQDIDLRVTVDRTRQRLASHAHVSQASPESALWRRLELLGSTESLRWLLPVRADVRRPLRVEYRRGDQFDISVRGHVVSVDQPVKDGGDDTAATPTELFVASLAACVAFYARRYLTRHGLPTHGLAVEATFDMGTRPSRVSAVQVLLMLPDGVPVERRAPLLAVASHCTVHNTLTTKADVSVTLLDAAGHA